MSRVEDKVKQLHQSHKTHLARPTLDDVCQEEAEIQTQTKEISEVFSECHNQLKAIRRSTLSLTGCEAIITQNLISFLSGRLQDVTSAFRKSQNEYLASKRISVFSFKRPLTLF